jgi:hypothetical protein
MNIANLNMRTLKAKLTSDNARAVCRGLKRGSVAASIGIAAFTGAAVLYKTSPEFKDLVSAASHDYPWTSNIAFSALTRGLIPDIIAQRYEGGKYSFARSLGMAAFAAINGGVMIREFYDLNNWLFPEHTVMSTVKKILVDQALFTPPSNTAFFAFMHLLHGRPIKSMLPTAWKQYLHILPVNTVIWSFMILPIIYNVSGELMIYTLGLFSMFWRAYMSHVSKVDTDIARIKGLPDL